MGLSITQEIQDKAYPTFYGQFVVVKVKQSGDPEKRHRLTYGIKPYAYVDGTPYEVNSETGLIFRSIFFKDEDLEKSYTSIHKFLQGLKDMKVKNGDTDEAPGAEGWFKQMPPRNGFQGDLLPVATPRVNGKPAPTPPAPEGWDMQQWLDEFGKDDEAEESGGSPAAAGVPSELYPVIKEAVVDKRRNQVGRALLSNSDLVSYGLPNLQAVVDGLVTAGEITLDDDGVYRAAA